MPVLAVGLCPFGLVYAAEVAPGPDEQVQGLDDPALGRPRTEG
jgi:hypothetical protein